MTLADLTNVTLTDNKTIPPGQYKMKCIEVDMKETKAGTGRYIKAKLRVEEGEMKGRCVWHNFNIQNPSEKATEIGLRQLKSFLTCAGKDVQKLESETELVNCVVIAALKVKKDEQYGDKNEVSYFKEIKAEEKAAF